MDTDCKATIKITNVNNRLCYNYSADGEYSVDTAKDIVNFVNRAIDCILEGDIYSAYEFISLAGRSGKHNEALLKIIFDVIGRHLYTKIKSSYYNN